MTLPDQLSGESDADRCRRAEESMADLAAVLRWTVRFTPGWGYQIVGLCTGSEPFATREEAEARCLEFVRREYGKPGRG